MSCLHVVIDEPRILSVLVYSVISVALEYNYDIYMDTAIIDDETVYSFEEGFAGVLLNSGQTDEKLKKEL